MHNAFQCNLGIIDPRYQDSRDIRRYRREERSRYGARCPDWYPIYNTLSRVTAPDLIGLDACLATVVPPGNVNA
jgi:hypothetical protein